MDCVVGGFTYAADKQTVDSLLLGLFDDSQNLRYVGSTRLAQNEGRRIAKDLESKIQEPGFVRRKDGNRFVSHFQVWFPVIPAVVVEVRYDRFTGGHFRHGTKFIRRPDKSPRIVCFRF